MLFCALQDIAVITIARVKIIRFISRYRAYIVPNEVKTELYKTRAKRTILFTFQFSLVTCHFSVFSFQFSLFSLFLVRGCQICSITKEDPLGIVHLVQPEGSYFWGWDKDVAPYHDKDYLA